MRLAGMMTEADPAVQRDGTRAPVFTATGHTIPPTDELSTFEEGTDEEDALVSDAEGEAGDKEDEGGGTRELGSLKDERGRRACARYRFSATHSAPQPRAKTIAAGAGSSRGSPPRSAPVLILTHRRCSSRSSRKRT